MSKEYIKLVNKNGFQGIEEPWCNNQGVAILPFIIKDNKKYYIQIHENNPLLDENKIGRHSTITGGLENLNTIETVKMELAEEIGIYINNKCSIYSLGAHYSSKSSSKVWHLFAVDLTKLNINMDEILIGSQDGTEFEKSTYGHFISEEELQFSNDTFALTIYAKMEYLIKNSLLETRNISEKFKEIPYENFSYEPYPDELKLTYEMYRL